ncbi:hypothetical protein JKP88DRAFT_224258 [Tribonema minus]|uniref:Peptidase M41 domain-containing protein n=1 Tax=Tribonema minus TaxID=303371 RepID=A0A836CBI2_9STRA|nr:hypothetical protein JKP88DRAFT_224258 [Tribonema minus]
MIMRLGFGSSIGLFAPSDWSALSELTSQKIEQEIQTILEEQYERAKALVAANMEPLRALERLLLEQEVVHEAGLKALLGEKATPDDNNTSTAAATLLPASSASAPDAGATAPKAAAAPVTAEPAEEELAGLAVLAMRGGAGRREL